MKDLSWMMIQKLLFSLDPETAHHLTLKILEHFGHYLFSEKIPNNLSVDIAGLKFQSPIGLAAGLDKDGQALKTWPRLGFGFMEIGAITPEPQFGNAKPRLYRDVQNKNLINKMGFNNLGSLTLLNKLENLPKSPIPLGINIGKNKETPLEKAADDYLILIKRLENFTDYFTINISSPNTQDLRKLQEPDRLKYFLEPILNNQTSKPIFLKLSPDATEQEIISTVITAKEMGISGFIATNTTLNHSFPERGGLSGRSLWAISKPKIKLIVEHAENIPVIGVGGIESTEQVIEFLNLGCKAIQIYSALIFHGPYLISKINHKLDILKQNGILF